jgi:PAS domain S-box-containing protein
VPTTRVAGADGLLLPPEAPSARTARRHVRTVLGQAGRAAWSEAAELAVSEVVTNAVLHAHTSLVLRVVVGPDEALVEVEDGSAVLPTRRVSPDGHAGTTGRGLTLLSALTRAHGVRATPAGKVVWFTVAEPPAEPDRRTPLELERPADAVAPPGVATRRVVLLGVPPTLEIAARDHQQSLLRELVLWLAEHADELPARPDLVRADAARSLLWTALLAELERRGTPPQPLVPGRLRPPQPAVDVLLDVPPDLEGAFDALQDALDVGERLAVAGRLLTRPGLPEIVAVRDWACEQVVAQLAGVPPSPWPGADDERFTARDGARAASGWDASVVTGSAAGVVAADDSNRILAVSPRLAAVTGWQPEDLVGRRIVALVPPSLREAHVAGFTRHLTTGQAHLIGVDLVLPLLHADGHEVSCTFRLERAVTDGPPVYLAWIEPVLG